MSLSNLNIFILDSHILRRSAIADILYNKHSCYIEGIEASKENVKSAEN